MDKKGAAGMSGLTIVAVLALVAMAGAVVYYVANAGTAASVAAPTTAVVQTASGTLTSEGCNVNPSLGTRGINALVTNLNLTPSNFGYIVNDQYIGAAYAAPQAGDKVTVLSNPTSYLSDIQSTTIACGVSNLDFKFKNYCNATVTIYTDAGTGILTNGLTGAVNETAMSSSKNWKVHMVGVSQKSTGKVFMVVEMPSNSAANISTVSVSCGGAALATESIPSYVSSTNTNAYRIGVTLPELSNGAVMDCYISASLIGSTTLGGAVRTSYYGIENYIDVDGKLKTGIYDSLGTAVYQDLHTYNFMINS